MKQGWERKKLKEVCEKITRGISPKYIEKKGIVVLNQKCIRDHKINLKLSRIHDNTKKKVSPEKLIKQGDVLVNSTGVGTLGRVAQVRELLSDMVTVDSHISIVRPIQDKFYLDFFGYAMRFIENEIELSGSGASGQTELARTVLENNFTITYPNSHYEQQRIVAILDETFAAIAKAKANAEQNLKNAKELFESYLQSVFENKGEDWEEKELIEVCEQITDGSHFSPKSSSENVYPYITVRDIVGDLINFDDCKFINKSDYQSLLKYGCKPNPGDLLFSKDGTVGKVSLIDFEKDFVVLSSLAIIRPKSKIIISPLLKYVLKNPVFLTTAIGMKTGVAIRRIILKNLKLIKISFPKSTKAQQSIVQKLDALSSETKKLEAIYKKKLNDLEELKKSVLQKAFNGELKTSKAMTV